MNKNLRISDDDGPMEVELILKKEGLRTRVFKGRLFCSKLPTPAVEPTLTPREREIVRLLADGKSNKEVSLLLAITVNTVETHRTNIMRKLEYRSMSQLVRYAIRQGLIQA